MSVLGDMDIKGVIFDIKSFAIHDGPGIRTTVFFKGCPLRCDWCHNPESQSLKPVLAQFKNNCIGCYACVKSCPHGALAVGPEGIKIDRQSCQACGACACACPAEALVLRGKTMTVSEVLAEVLKDKPFFDNSGGGITLSGGEPLFQPDFALALLQAAKELGLHTCLDTSGYAPWEVWERILPYTDLVLYDVKCMDMHRHRRHTGRSNSRILENLRALTSNGVAVKVRMPIVPGFNDTLADVEATARFLKSLPHPPSLELLPYHKLGESKYEALGIANGFHAEPPPRTQLELLAEAARRFELACEIGS